MKESEYENLKKSIKQANRRLRNLQKFTDRNVSWAAKNLQSKIDNEKIGAWSNRDLIKISKDMSDNQLERVYKATQDFLNSNVSTIKGVKKAIQSVKKGISVNIGVSEKEAESLYEALNEDTFRWANKYSQASKIWATIEEAKENNYSQKRFRDRFLDVLQVENDIEVSNNIKSIYERYVK